jgi:hypothetical protein
MLVVLLHAAPALAERFKTGNSLDQTRKWASATKVEQGALERCRCVQNKDGTKELGTLTEKKGRIQC